MTQFFLHASGQRLPRVYDSERAKLGMRRWEEAVTRLDDPRQAQEMAHDAAGRKLLEAIFSHSPFLTQCLLADVDFLVQVLNRGPDVVVSQVSDRLKRHVLGDKDRRRVMRALRIARREMALLVAVADMTGHWPLERVTAALSDFADLALSVAVAYLLRSAEGQGEIVLRHPEAPEQDCGYLLLAMGKLGARELNYSSDIDLIVLFDPDKVDYRGRRSPQEAMVRLTRDLVSLMEERTADGIVNRVDLRLRPDPGAMPVAIAYNAAMSYYESLGQNWERAAMIKARPAAGDLALGSRFLTELSPFIWRKHLDFWAIQDIHSIKRQINAHRGGETVAVLGHNVKLGRGGIREIEFFAQTQQLIYGGRDPRLRAAGTREALDALAATGRIDRQAAEELGRCYAFLRGLEHRLQMVDDQQTHNLPKDSDGVARIAAFLAYDREQSFRDALLDVLRRVEDYYAELFEESPSLSDPGNLVFTGGEADPDTLDTLHRLGFEDGRGIFEVIRGWHHGRLRATRSTRSRELLTELLPVLLQALGKAPNPDAAFARFGEFLGGLPAGVQLFAMLTANPTLLDLLVEIMGSAPALAEHLSRNPSQLEAVLSAGFYEHLPEPQALEQELAETLGQAADFQDLLDLARRWANDRKFQVGINVLRHTIDAQQAGASLSAIADAVLRSLYQPVRTEFVKLHGELPGPGMVVLALGKLGAREMTHSSDLDLICVYQVSEAAGQSDGAKPLAPSEYFARLAQRYINALTALTGEGRLYAIDMRLRPSGTAGPITTSLEGFRRYHEKEAWTWEEMTLTRARPVVGEPDLVANIEAVVRSLLTRPHDADTLLVDVAAMRARIARQFPAKSLWNIKYLRGGLVDLDFIAQYLQLRHAAQHPEVLDRSTQGAFAKLARAKLLGTTLAARLIKATRLMRQLQNLLRLTVGEPFDAPAAPEGLKRSLARAGGAADFAALEEKLLTTAVIVHEAFVELIAEPGRQAEARLAEQEARLAEQEEGRQAGS